MPQTELRRRIGGRVEYRAAATEGEAPSRRVEGYALLFDTPSAPFEDTDSRFISEEIAPTAVTRELLDASDIEMNFNHDRARILARSVGGAGSLSYEVDERGVRFAFDAPATADGDMILEHIRRGDLRGCSFCFSTDYDDPAAVEITSRREEGREIVTIRHLRMNGIYDFAITPDPAYPDTSVELRSALSARLAAHQTEGEERGEREERQAVDASRARLRALNNRIKFI